MIFAYHVVAVKCRNLKLIRFKGISFSAMEIDELGF